MTAAAATADKLDEWAAIHAPDCPLHLEPRNPPLSAATLAEMLSRPPAMFKFDETPDGIADHYADLPADLIADVSPLARRFAAVMDVARISARCSSASGGRCN